MRTPQQGPSSGPVHAENTRPSRSLSFSGMVQVNERNDHTAEPNVIAVPGYCMPSVQNWGLSEGLQQAAVDATSISSVHMFMYESTYTPVSGFSWEYFLRAGSELAEELARLASEALVLAYDNVQDPRFRLVMECLSGILFMGTPHASDTDKDTLLRHNQILFSCANVSAQKQVSRLPKHDAQQLAHLAVAFQQIATIPLLSVYEYPEPRSGVPRLFGKKNKTLVDRQLATIWSETEKLLGVHLSHSELCKISLLRDEKYSAREFLQSLFADIGDDRRWVGNADIFGTSLLRVPDPLNPLKLASVEPLRSGQESVTTFKTREDRPTPSIALELPLRLHQIRNSNNNQHLLHDRQSKLPCYSVPQHPNTDFTGRTDVFAAIDEYLLPRSAPQLDVNPNTRLFALCGMGGIGKTDVAIHYALSRKHNFGAIFWLEAGGVSQLASDFGRIAQHLGLQTDDEASSLESSIEISKAWLSQPRSVSINDRWLLIFDNADNLDIITGYVPFHGGGSVLVTSRNPFAKEDLFFSEGRGIDVEPLPRADSAALLRRLCTKSDNGRESDEENASLELADYLAGLPLAMTQMAGFIRKRHLSIREFMELYATDARYSEVRDVAYPTQEKRYGHTLATAYNFEGLSVHAMKLLQILAFVNPDRVQEYIFTRPPGYDIGADSYWRAATFESARFELIDSSIIKRNVNKKEMWIHRVIQAEVRARMDVGERFKTFQDAVALLGEVWPPGDHCSQRNVRWTVCEQLLPHLERFYQLYVDNSTDWDLFNIDHTFPMLLNEAGVYLHERGFSHEGKPYLRLSLTLCKQSNITIEPLISDMHLTMGALSNETNDAQACLEHNILCLSIRKRHAAKGNAPDLRLAFAHSQMGIAYMMVRKFALATEYFKQSVEMLKMIDCDEDEYGFPVCNLGLAYWVQDELDDADRTLTDLLIQRERLHGYLDTVSYKTGRVLHALGNVRESLAMRSKEQGEHAKAQEYWAQSFDIHTKCLKQYESTLGAHNHRTADACHKLAQHHIRREEHALAQNYLDRALSIWGDRYWYKNESARSSFLLGTHLLSLDGEENTRMGKRWVQRAKCLRREILPDEEPRELDNTDFDDLVCFWSI